MGDRQPPEMCGSALDLEGKSPVSRLGSCCLWELYFSLALCAFNSPSFGRSTGVLFFVSLFILYSFLLAFLAIS